MAKVGTIQASLLVLMVILNIGQSDIIKSCHYSCSYCGDPFYSHCIICADGFSLAPIKNKDNTSPFYNTLEEYPWGTCLGRLNTMNTLGIMMFCVVIFFVVWLKNRTMVYFLSTMQMFGLFSLIQVGYVGPISYLMQGFEYFMFTTALNKSNKQEGIEIFNANRYRLFQFMKAYDFHANFLPVFLFSLAACIITLIIPLIRYCSKQEGSLWSIFSCSTLNIQKVFTCIELSAIMTFLFLIQECILVITIGLFEDPFLDKNAGNIVMIVVYAVMLGFMVINVCWKNLDLFGNKAAEQIQVLRKCLLSPFVILPIRANVAVAPFAFFLCILGLVFCAMKTKDKRRTQFHQNLIKRQFRYRILQMIIIVLVVVYWVIQKFGKSYSASLAVGIVNVVAIGAFMLCFLVEVGIEMYGKYYLKEDQKLYHQVMGQSMTSLRQSKMLEETMENFETTEEGIMDMIFFGRGIDNVEKEKAKKPSNIKLDMDHLNESNSNNMDQRNSVSAHSSPKHRDNEKFKSKTARTPKHDRSSRFKLNKVFDNMNSEQNEEEIQKVEVEVTPMSRMNKETIREEVKGNENGQQVKGNGNEGNQDMEENGPELISIQNNTPSVSARSNNNPLPKTSRTHNNEPIKTVREIRVQVADDKSAELSPRFGDVEIVSNVNMENRNEQPQVQADKGNPNDKKKGLTKYPKIVTKSVKTTPVYRFEA